MKKSNTAFNLFFTLSILTIISLIIISVILITTDRIMLLFELFGLMGLIGFVVTVIANLILNRSKPKDNESEEYHNYYISLIEKAERNPKAFERSIKRLTYTGYYYILILFIFILISITGAIVILLASKHVNSTIGVYILGLFSILYIIAKSLYIKPGEVNGNVINSKEYPHIFKVIKNAREKTGAADIDKVIVYQDANCAVSNMPVGFSLKSHNIMFLGAYLLELLNENELEAIFIHEFAHIYNKDTVISSKVNMQITRWQKILEACESKGWIQQLFLTRFAIFYINKMQYYLMAISKQMEYIADSEAALHAGKETYYKASIKIELFHYYLNKDFYPDCFDVRSLETPPRNYINILFEGLYKRLDKYKDEWISQITKRISSKYDTHPSFSERMHSIGIEEFDINISFENKINKNEVSSIICILNKEWYDNILPEWEKYRKDYIKDNNIVDNYETTDDLQKIYEYGLALERLLRFDDALNLYNTQLENHSDNVVFKFRKGIILLLKNNDTGISFIKDVMENNYEYINSGLEAIREYFISNGLVEDMTEMREYALRMSERYNKITYEIEHLNVNDLLVKANISDELREGIKQKLIKLSTVKSAFLVTKKLKYSDSEILVLAVLSEGKTLQNIDELVKIQEETKLPRFLINLNTNPSFMSVLRNVENSEIV